ncbi:hypothetical protein EV183_005348, partial [Coemansia sp. RSA 2336]
RPLQNHNQNHDLNQQHPLQWTPDDVAHWAQGLPLIAAVAPLLRQHAVDGHVLINYVTNAVLADELGVAAFGTRVHVLEAIEALRWSHAIRARPPHPRLSPSSSPSPESSSADPPPSKRSASRVADAEKKRQKRAALKQNPVLYAEYLQKERERNARRRARLRAERARSDAPDALPTPDALPAPAYAPYAADPPVIVRHSLHPPPHNLRSAPERPDAPAHLA